jgi:hypothetical protein
MSWSRWLIGVLCAFMMVAQGCRTEPVTWRTPVHEVQFLLDTLSWPNLVPDTLWTAGDAGLVLEVQSERGLVSALDLVPSLDTSWIDVLTLPFIGGPVPIASGTSVWSDSEEIGLAIPFAGLRRARLGGGTLSISVTSTVQGPLTLRYAIEGASFPTETNGGSEVVVVEVDSETSSVQLDLTGVVLDLEGQSGEELSRLATSWEVLVSPLAPQGVGIMGSDQLTLAVDLSGIEVAQVEGRFDAQTWSMSDGLTVGGLDAIQELQVGWTELTLDLVFNNTSGLDLSGAVNALVREDEAEGIQTTTSLSSPALGQAVFLTRAAIAGTESMDDWTVVPTQGGLQFSSTEGSLAEFMGTLPQALSWDVQVEVNPLGDVSGGHDRVDLTQLPSMALSLKAPLEVSSLGAVFIDTLELVPPDWIGFDGLLTLDLENSMPVGATLFLELVDLPEYLLRFETIYPQELWAIGEVTLPLGSGDPNLPAASVQEVELENVHFEALRNGARLMAVVVLEASEEGARFEVDQSIIVRGHLNGDAILSFE